MEIRDRILEGLADGKSLRVICAEDGMPSVPTVIRWAHNDDEWAEQYARARLAGDDVMFEDIQAIADDDEIKTDDKRVRIDARKWMLGKRQPKRFGDKLDLTSDGKALSPDAASWLGK